MERRAHCEVKRQEEEAQDDEVAHSRRMDLEEEE